MKRIASKRKVDHRQTTEEDSSTTLSTTFAEERVINNRPSAEKLALIQQKRQEADETAKINELSAQMVTYFRQLASGIEAATSSARKTGDSLQNWEQVFTAMGEMNRGATKESETWVRFKTAPSP